MIRSTAAPSASVLKVMGALVVAAILYLAVKDRWERQSLAAAGKAQAIAHCIELGQPDEACQDLEASRHDACWEFAYRPGVPASKSSPGRNAIFNQDTFNDCVQRGAEALARDAARAHEAASDSKRARDAVMH